MSRICFERSWRTRWYSEHQDVENWNCRITLMQSHYVEKVLSHFGYSYFTPLKSYDPSAFKESKNNWRSAKLFSKHWLTNVFSQHNDLEDDHLNYLEMVMHFLMGISGYDIYYIRYMRLLEWYSDQISNADEINAMNIHVFTLVDGGFTLNYCKNTILTRSTK